MIRRLLFPLLLLSLFLTYGRALGKQSIVVLFTDDHQASTIAALGNKHIRTPHLDKLVGQGTAFDRAYMMGGHHGATCVPSRAMLLSGRDLYHIDEELVKHGTWPEAFATAGYRTFVSGKWHNGAPSLLRSFQDVRSMFMGGMANPLKARLQSREGDKMGAGKIAPKHACEVFADEAVEFLKASGKDPFLLYVPFDGPHDPHIVPDDFPVTYKPEDMPLPASFMPQHPWDNGEMTVRDEKLLPWPREPHATKQMLAEYYRYISYLDVQVGRILDALAASPQGANTLVVFTGDSGVARGGHGLIGKQNLYEHSVRVPLIIKGPGIAAGKRSQELCYLYDVFPTLGKLCGVNGPAGSQGRDLSPALAADAPSEQKPIREHLWFGYRDVQRAIRHGDKKLIRYPQVDKTQLFDLKTDPEETKNLAESPEHAAEVTRLLALLQQEMTAAGDACPLTVPDPKPAAWTPPVGKKAK